MSNSSLLGAVEFLRSSGQLPSRAINLRNLMAQFQPTPSDSLRALVAKMLSSAAGIDYRVIPIFWGTTFSLPVEDANFPSIPYSPQEMADALAAVADSGYFALLNQYGARLISINASISISDPWPTPSDGYYVTTFTEADITTFITQNLNNLPVFNAPPGQVIKPIYMVVIPHGSLLDPNALGAHNSFAYQGNNLIWFWMYGSSDLQNAVITATHEIAEAVGADGSAPKELCDDCKETYPDGLKTVNNLSVESYYDALTDSCVAPGSTLPEV